MSDCVRSISFVIPGANGGPGVRVTVVEKNGSLDFTASVVGNTGAGVNMQGLYFDFADSSLLSGLSATGAQINAFDTENVIDLGGGNNMRGAASPFDVGLGFSAGSGRNSVVTSTQFTLSSSAGALTLDDLAHMEFGARLTGPGGNSATGSASKLTVIAPAAPDAVDDSYQLFEDGQADVQSPAAHASGVKLQVLSNDTDADGQTLTITSVHVAQHGTVQIVDGDDADLLIGDALLYTPTDDYAGQDTFEYCVTDGNGGTDFAQVNLNITAVADRPDVTVEMLAGADVNEVIVRVTATQTDDDGSEYIDKIVLTGLPEGVTADALEYDPSSDTGTLTRDFRLTLPVGQDTDFVLQVSAVSAERVGGDSEQASADARIQLDFNHTLTVETFSAEDQNQWGAGEAFSLDYHDFIGPELSWDESVSPFPISAGVSGHLKAGLQVDLSFDGGDVDATLPYELTVDTHYNISTDMLKISSDAVLAAGASFDTEGPEGSVYLEAIFDFLMEAYIGVDYIGQQTWSVEEYLSHVFVDYASSDPAFNYDLGGGFSAFVEWPHLLTQSEAPQDGILQSSGASNDVLGLNLDVDELIFSLLGIPESPLDIHYSKAIEVDLVLGTLAASVDADITLADLDLRAALKFLQDFTLDATELQGQIVYENGATSNFVFGQDILISNASALDANGDGDIGFALNLDPNAFMKNQTSIGLDVGFEFRAFEAAVTYDLPGTDPNSIHVGPVVHAVSNVPIAELEIYSNTFALDFVGQSVDYSVALGG